MAVLNLYRWLFIFFLISVPLSLALSDVALFLCGAVGLYLFVSGEFKPARPHATPFRSFIFFLIAAFFSVALSLDKVHSLISLKELRPFLLLLAIPFLIREKDIWALVEISGKVLGITVVALAFVGFGCETSLRIVEKFVTEGHLTLMAIQTVLFSSAVMCVSFVKGKERFDYVAFFLLFTFFLLALVDANIPFFLALCAECGIAFFIFREKDNDNHSMKKHFLWLIPLFFMTVFILTGRRSDNYLLHLLPGYKIGVINEAKELALVDPFFGTGYNSFSVMNSLKEKRAYSDVITAYVNMGVLGVTALLVFLFDLIGFAYKLRARESRVSSAALIFTGIFFPLAFFNPMFFTPHGLRFLVAMWTLMEAVERRSRQ